MKHITKKSARLVGSAGSLAALLDAIQNKMYWTVQDTRTSEFFACRFGECMDIETGRGWKDDAVIICTNSGRWGLYFV